MGLFDKLFGKKPTPPPLPPSPKEGEPIKVFDGYGRELHITREAWRTILPGNLKAVWNDPEQLAQLVIQCMQDEFFAEMQIPAEHLVRIDPNRERAAAILGIVYLKLGLLDAAEKALQRYVEDHGPTGSILTNLAKVYAARGQQARVDQTLWRALEMDPNLDNGLMWQVALARERGGDAGADEALRKVASLPKSWRARVWLARTALLERRLDDALSLYGEALTLAPRPVPTEILQQISGDLGNHGHLPEILTLVAPHFDVAYHGLAVGSNLIKANLDLGRLDAAQVLLDQHYAQKRFDWQQALSFWDTEIGKARAALSPGAADLPPVAMLAIDGPVWLRSASPAAELFPAKPGDAPTICFLGSSAEMPADEQIAGPHLADSRGRLSRSLPLFLSEQIHFRTNAAGRLLHPWVQSPGSSILVGVPWSNEDAAAYARHHEHPSDYVVVCHLLTVTKPWKATIRLVQTIDAKLLGEAEASLAPENPEGAFFELSRALVRLLGEHADVVPAPSPAAYVLPMLTRFVSYQLRLEQALLLVSATSEGTEATSLNGEREIIDGNIQLCADEPTNVTTRVLLAETLRLMKKARPHIIPEFRDKIALLQKEKPLSQPARAVVQRMLDEVFRAT